MRLFDVAHRLASNIVSLRQLHSQGYWYDSRPDRNVLRRLDDSTVAKLLDRRDQFVLETTMLSVLHSLYERNKFNSWSQRKPIITDVWK